MLFKIADIFMNNIFLVFRRRRLHTFAYGSISLFSGALLSIGKLYAILTTLQSVANTGLEHCFVVSR